MNKRITLQREISIGFFNIFFDIILIFWRNDAIEEIENSIPDTSNMYNHWSTSVTLKGPQIKTVNLLTIPTYLVITGDLYSLYEFPNDQYLNGLNIDVTRSGRTLTFTGTHMMPDWNVKFDINIWY